MPLGRKVVLDPRDILLDGDPAPLPKRGQIPQVFSPCLLWPNGCVDQDATWYWVGLGSGHIVLDGGPAPLPQKGTALQFFAPCLLWPNGRMDQDATW